MSRDYRIDFAQQFKQHIDDGLSVADFVNHHAVRIGKDTDYLVMIAAESCLLAKQPHQIEALFEQLLHVENPQHKIDLITKGFEFLAPRNWKRPEVLNNWYLALVSPSAREYSMRLNKPWKILSQRANACSAFLYYMNITPVECRNVMETTVLEYVNKQVRSNPELFINVIPQMELPSSVKLQQYMTHNRSAFEKPQVVDTIFSSLVPHDQATFFFKFSQIHYPFGKNDTRFDDDFNLVHAYWEGMMPYVRDYIKTINEDSSGKLRQQFRFGILLVTDLTHDFLFNRAHTQNIDTVVELYEQIVTYLKTGRLVSYFDRVDKAVVLVEEMTNKIQALHILKEMDHSDLHKLKRRM